MGYLSKTARTPYTCCVESGYQILASLTPCRAWQHFLELQKNQWLTRQELEDLRWQRLKQLFNVTYDTIPFYRNLWKKCNVDPRKFDALHNMLDLPVVDKQILTRAQQEDGFGLSARNGYDVAHTSGTTGIRFQIPFTFETFQKKYANHLRQMYACGWRLGVSSATLHYSGHSQFRGRYTGRADDREPFMNMREAALAIAHRRRVLVPYHSRETGDDEQVRSWYEALAARRPYMFETLDFNLPILKDFIERHNLPRLHIPKTFVLGTYSRSLRSELQRFFATELFNRYSPHEIEGVAFSCNVHRGMHMAIDCYHTEFLDRRNQPAAAGETGEIVVTDMENYLMPLIRYRVGDVGHYYEEPCTCGRRMPLMGDIDGRTRDCFQSAAGALVTPSQVAKILQDEPGVVVFQAVQAENLAVAVDIVYSQNSAVEDITARIRRGFENLLGPAIPLSLNTARSIRLEQNGKCCFVKR
jgi:phenylacetate-CoA ligase